MEYPADLKYTSDHEWIRDNGDGTATVGVTDFAQSELGEIVYVEVDADMDTALDKEEAFGTVEAVKTTSDLYMPISGAIVEVNEALEDAPETVNESPYDKGWIIKMKIGNPEEMDALLSAEDYKAEISA